MIPFVRPEVRPTSSEMTNLKKAPRTAIQESHIDGLQPLVSPILGSLLWSISQRVQSTEAARVLLYI